MHSRRILPRLCIIGALSVGQGSLAPPDSGSLLADFILFLRVPLRVAAFVCWNNEKSVRFVRKLMAHGYDGRSPHFLQLRNESVDNLPLLDTLEPHQHLAVVDRACPNADQFLLEAQYRIYHKIRWVVLDGDHVAGEHREVDIFDIINGLPVTANSNLFYFVRSADGQTLVKDVYRTSMTTGLVSSVIAIWKNGTFTDTGIGQPISIRRRNLHRASIRTTLVYNNNYTLQHFDDYENPQIDSPTRMSYILMRILYDIYLNATMNKRYVTSWCFPNSPGVCSEIINNLTDVGGSLMFMIKSRFKFLEYTILPIRGYVRFIYRTPRLSTTDNIFRLPFQSTVWSCTIGLIILTGVLFLAVSYVQALTDRIRADPVDASFDIIPIALQQGSNANLVSLSQRMLVLVSLVGLMFLEVSYSAKIISLIQAPSEKISTLQDLLDSKLEVGCENTTYNRNLMPTATEPVRRALYEQKIRLKNGSMNLYELQDGIAKIRKGLFAYHVYTSSGYHQVAETFEEIEKCSLRELTFFDLSQAHIPVRKNFTLREHINMGLMRILESGIYAREYRKMTFVRPRCTKGVYFQPLNAIDIRFSVELMAWGVATAILILLVEAIWSRSRYTSRVPVLPYVE